MSETEIREYIQQSHDLCRIGKAERLQRIRDLQTDKLNLYEAFAQYEYDAKYYKIDFAIDFPTQTVDGYVEMVVESEIAGLTSLAVDLHPDLTVDSIVKGGTQLFYTRTGDKIQITTDQTYNLNDEFSFTIYYNGHPPTGGFQAFSFDYHGSPPTPIASTLSEPYFARTWWPCKDYPDDKADSVDIIITHRDDFVCASNGTLQSIVDNGDGTKTTHWHEQYPITTYLVSICVTNYDTFSNWYITADNDSMPVTYWVYPENLGLAQSSFPVTVDMIEVAASLFGEYPFIEEKYGMSQFPWGGAMEHQTNTSINSGAYYESIIMHELGHQWYGDMITCENWHEIWMNEGFATYSEALWVENQESFTSYKSYMNGMRYTAGGTIWCQDTTSVWSIFSSRVYDKGAWALHMLRHVVGDSTFFDILDVYYDDPRYKWGDINTIEFRDLCEDVSGMDLTAFFDDWIFGEYYPRYRYSYDYEEYAPGDYVIYLHLRQSQSTNPQVFDMPVDIDISDGTNTFSYVVENNQRGQDYILYMNEASGPPLSIEVDDDDWILKTVAGEAYDFHVIYDDISSGVQYEHYVDSVIARGGSEPYEFSIISGSLPNGVTLDQHTGRIEGYPTQAGPLTFTARVEDNTGDWETEQYSSIIAVGQFNPGDVNSSGGVDIDDIVYLIAYVFAGGPDPIPVNAGDVNQDCQADIDDVVYLIAHVFDNGPDPLPGCIE